MVNMMQRNFHTKYRPGKELSLDESTCPFKGRVHFKSFNSPQKTNRFHIKLFMVSKPSTGYICGFEVYTGDASGQSQGNTQELQDASKTCIVLGLLDSVQLLDMGHHVYFDNYYNSPDLIDLLHNRKTCACCSVRKNQKSLPLAVTQVKLKQGETVFHCKNNRLALKWMNKREVYILSGLHKATNVISKKLITKGKR